MSATNLNVISTKTRIIGFDVARALAIFGMIIVNFKVVLGGAENGPNFLVWLAGLLDGRAAAMFVILAGVGISMLSRRGRETQDEERIKHDKRRLFKRALFLFIVGLLYTPLWPADILHFYGIYIGISILFLTASDQKLWACAISVTLASSVLMLFFNYEKGWDFTTLTYLDFWTVEGMLRHLFYNGFHPVIPWLAFLLIGMVLGRKELRVVQTRRKILWGSLLVSVVSEGVSFLLTSIFPGEFGMLFDTKPMPPTLLYILASAGTAIAIILLCLELTFKFKDASIFTPWVATGQLALTLYVAHVVIGMGTLEVFGLLKNQTIQFAMAYALIFFAASTVFSYYWRRFFKRGPLEWMMRKITD